MNTTTESPASGTFFNFFLNPNSLEPNAYFSLSLPFQVSEEVAILLATPKMLLPSSSQLPAGAPLSAHHQIQLLQQQLQQQQQQTQVSVAQVRGTAPVAGAQERLAPAKQRIIYSF